MMNQQERVISTCHESSLASSSSLYNCEDSQQQVHQCDEETLCNNNQDEANDDDDDGHDTSDYDDDNHYVQLEYSPYYNYDHDDDDDSDDYDETQSREEVFYADGSCATINIMEEGSKEHYSRIPTTGDDDIMTLDFHSLAQQALQSLDSEYIKTVRMTDGDVAEVEVEVEVEVERKSIDIDNDDDDDDIVRGGVDENAIDIASVKKSDNTSAIATTLYHDTPPQQNDNRVDHPDGNGNVTESLLMTTNNHKTQNVPPTLDTTAISKAMKNLLQSNLSIQEKFSKWKPMHCSYTPFLVPTVHSIIPNKALLAFQRYNSHKAQLATANLTRSATLAEAMNRIFLENEKTNMENGNDELWFVIHCIGADGVECQYRETIVRMFQPIVKWMNRYQPNLFLKHGGKSMEQNEMSSSLEFVRHLRIELLGPNVPLHSEDFGMMNLLLPNGNSNNSHVHGKLESATVVCKNCMYHDYLAEIEETLKGQGRSRNHYPNLIIAYNAGIWGYTDWHPTLRSLYNLKRRIPFVITAYTIYEAEDDAQVLDEVLLQEELNVSENAGSSSSSSNASRCIWSPELNPYASRIV
eukprot:CAMPEP_0176493452 /NCGR_PEP_ID=MMETSP0200_2-20121128/9556_1 /TAXON_ID=947934 /ORGANISM="Chaetoceros sp., Strain GSL56" /LENGTH=579 /DNA_ID=CAMNT_0017891115 /DNA_START=66 /DNA_END=1802 /DNA_ORIENTATION=-